MKIAHLIDLDKEDKNGHVHCVHCGLSMLVIYNKDNHCTVLAKNVYDALPNDKHKGVIPCNAIGGGKYADRSEKDEPR
jgi:hypothetical protein